MNMSSLKTISIARNKILTLSEQVFAPVWEQLEDFQAMGQYHPVQSKILGDGNNIRVKQWYSTGH